MCASSDDSGVAAVRDALHVRSSVEPMNDGYAEVVEELIDAIRHGRKCQFAYEAIYTGERKNYLVSPRHLVLYKDVLYLLAHKESDEFRVFEVDGIDDVKRIRGSSRRRAVTAHLPSAVLVHSFGMYKDFGEPVDVTLEVRGEWSRRLQRRRYHLSQRIERANDGEPLKCFFKVLLCPDFIAFVRGIGGDLVSAAPPQLVERLQVDGRCFCRAGCHAVAPEKQPQVID